MPRLALTKRISAEFSAPPIKIDRCPVPGDNALLCSTPLIPNRVFVLCTGRCGSVTFAKASAHINNFSAGHETRCHLTGPARFAYPERHIEADNRLSWLLGRLDRIYGEEPLYVHLTRDAEEVARSYLKRSDRGIILAYRTEILMRAAKLNKEDSLLDFCRDYVQTVTDNILHFLRDKPLKMSFSLDSAKDDFKVFWETIGAEGNLKAALTEWDTRHNKS